MEKEKTTIMPTGDKFKLLYYELKDKMDDDQHLFARDITELIDIYLQQKLREGTLINIAFRGEPGSGKSVVALELTRRSNIHIEKYFNKKINMETQIASDQGELLRKSKEEDIRYTCVEVDEFDPLMASGANATTEQKEFEFFSDLCRVYYIHRISCSPTKIADPNVNIVFDVLSKDSANKKTFVKILYRNSLEARWVQLGVAWIDVSETLKASWYKTYEKKKEQRVDLLTKHGLRGVRELEFAQVSKLIVQETSKIIDQIEDKSSINSLLRIKAINKMQQLYKRPISFIAEDEIIKPATAIIGLLQSIGKLSIEVNGETVPKEGKERAFKTFQEELAQIWDEMERKVEIYEKYKNIMVEEKND